VIVVSVFAAIVLMIGCASSDSRVDGNERRLVSARSNEGYYAVIQSIEFRPAGDGHVVGSPGDYSIRVRFDDRTYESVPQSSLDDLRVGDSVRIERGRVRRY
jgi:hypothetical protein